LQAEISVQSKEIEELEDRQKMYVAQRNEAVIALDKRNIDFERLEQEYASLKKYNVNTIATNKLFEEKIQKLSEPKSSANARSDNSKLIEENKTLTETANELQRQLNQNQETAQLLNEVLIF
jgi:hypothetical protein